MKTTACKFQSANKRKILVSGPYGGLNLGDDAIASVICEQLKKRGVDVVLAVIDMENAKNIYSGVVVVERLNLRNGKFSVLASIKESDAVMVGGGEQLSESRIPNPIWGHLATNLQLCFLSKVFNKKFMILGVGVDSRISVFGLFMLKIALRITHFIGVRDKSSYKRLLALAINKKDILLGTDPAFLLKPICRTQARYSVSDKFGISPNRKIVLIIPSNDKFSSLNYLEIINIVTKWLLVNGVAIIYALSDLQKSYDLKLYHERLLFESELVYWWPPGEGGVDGIRTVIAASDCIVSSRMHPLIFSLVNKTPFVCLSRSSKMDALMDMLGITDYLSLTNFTKTQLLNMIQTRLLQTPDEFFQPISGRLDELKARSSAQFDVAIECLTNCGIN